MALEVLQEIKEHEIRANELQIEARHEAREMLKGVESVTAEHERNVSREHRNILQQKLAEYREEYKKNIDEQINIDRVKEEEKMKLAENKISEVADLIVEKVLNYGDK